MDNDASSSGSTLRWNIIRMGFEPSMVDQVIQEKGEEDVDLVLETLFNYSGIQSSDAQSLDSVEKLFVDQDDTSELIIDISSDSEKSSFGDQDDTSARQTKPEYSDAFDAYKDNDRLRASLLSLNFSRDQIDFALKFHFALDKFGLLYARFDAPINELVDFISASQTAAKSGKETVEPKKEN